MARRMARRSENAHPPQANHLVAKRSPSLSASSRANAGDFPRPKTSIAETESSVTQSATTVQIDVIRVTVLSARLKNLSDKYLAKSSAPLFATASGYHSLGALRNRPRKRTPTRVSDSGTSCLLAMGSSRRASDVGYLLSYDPADGEPRCRSRRHRRTHGRCHQLGRTVARFRSSSFASHGEGPSHCSSRRNRASLASLYRRRYCG